MMKRTVVIVCLLVMAAAPACKKKGEAPVEEGLAKKYALYQVSVYKDRELKDWLATLEKAESVNLLGEEQHVNLRKVQLDLSRVRLSDDKEGYVESRHLGDRPIVFVQDNVRLFVRPDIGSTVFATVPKGTIGFIREEKAEWVKVYVGKAGNKWVTGQWVKDGYNSDLNLVVEAKDYEAAMNLLGETRPEKVEGAVKAAKEKLEALSGGSSAVADLARSKLDELEGRAPQAEKEESPEAPVEPGEKAPSE